jgi:hypothetical protein
MEQLITYCRQQAAHAVVKRTPEQAHKKLSFRSPFMEEFFFIGNVTKIMNPLLKLDKLSYIRGENSIATRIRLAPIDCMT